MFGGLPWHFRLSCPLLPVQMWNLSIVALDAFYTALWVPIAATFNVPHHLASLPGAIDFIVGIILCIDILIRFQAPIYLTSTYKAVCLTQPRAIARYYVFHGSFILDALAAVPLLFLPLIAENRNILFTVFLLRILRLTRVKRVIDMLFYIQMLSISGASSITMIVGSVVSILYTIFVMVNLLACIWYWVGTHSLPNNGWLAQEYSALVS